MKNSKEAFIPDKKLAAVCGLFCPSCTIYIASKEDPERLAKLAERLHKTVEETRCDGCRSEKRTSYCHTCGMVKCAAEKGIIQLIQLLTCSAANAQLNQAAHMWRQTHRR